MTVRMPILRSSSKRSRMPPLTTSFRWMTPSTKLSCATTSGVPPARRDLVDLLVEPRRHLAALLLDEALDRVGRALPELPAVHVDAAHPRRRGEGDEGRLVLAELAAAQAVALLREHDDRAPLGRLVRERGELRRPRRARARSTPSTGTNSAAWRLPSVIVPVLSSSSTSTSPDASTARPDIASTLRWTRRSIPAMPIADRSAPIVVGISATSSAISTVCEMRRAGVDRERPQRHDRGQERDRQAREQDVERDLVRRLAPLGALDERDHPVEERLARLLRDLDDELVREQLRAAGDGRAVAAGLADHRRGLAGDRRLVDRADALDDLAVGRDDLAGGDDDDVAALQLGRRRRPRARRRPGAGERWSSCASRGARSPAPCRGPRRSPRRSSRTGRSARARPRSRRRTRAGRCRRGRGRARRSPS